MVLAVKYLPMAEKKKNWNAMLVMHVMAGTGFVVDTYRGHGTRRLRKEKEREREEERKRTSKGDFGQCYFFFPRGKIQRRKERSLRCACTFAVFFSYYQVEKYLSTDDLFPQRRLNTFAK